MVSRAVADVNGAHPSRSLQSKARTSDWGEVFPFVWPAMTGGSNSELQLREQARILVGASEDKSFFFTSKERKKRQNQQSVTAAIRQRPTPIHKYRPV